MITGLDLVEWQLRIAMGERLPLRQDDIARRGHAIEARVYAEDAAAGFLPSIGEIYRWRAPVEGAGLRIDTGFGAGDAVSRYYDPMLAKVIAHAETREAALTRLRSRPFRISKSRASPRTFPSLCACSPRKPSSPMTSIQASSNANAQARAASHLQRRFNSPLLSPRSFDGSRKNSAATPPILTRPGRRERRGRCSGLGRDQSNCAIRPGRA